MLMVMTAKPLEMGPMSNTINLNEVFDILKIIVKL
jgi:hypothetical protein